ncbi:extracellular solute-binding protein family 1 [Xylanimonas cellulosilytica DSM 15894]|uniref:Extracellular solute-binding protein family 1 n=1 Tax=Xylanimonas cellulosilytica (strain DSM 15894 / JCM 12276 / CECT 5975 / KCTC 9989 / LMG 20990 / NBRC 107835 / XIL07) TaxID=446471 RepID=D1C0N4_XYLCX|nr:ABC transporter substrate-binding protein [Xylanimonas cellulosilytica]ACZ32237.1 extracellular solute-binding protein family 1 [Xylanimonas cellulosilytica DSM 15894]
MTRTPRNAGRRRVLAFGAGVASLALVLAACSSDGDGGDDGDGDGNGAAESSIDCSVFEEFGDLSGTTVSVYTSIVDPESQSHIDSYVPFTECTGVEISYEGSREFEAQLPVRVQAGNPPDIAIVNQPGNLRTLVRQFDAVVPAPASVDALVDENFSESWKTYGTVDGTFYAAPYDANVKSFVWYSPTAFADAGYEIPTTWDDLLELTDTIAADTGLPPWCAGVESGDATGWPGTDFIEDMVLRTAGIDVYNQWTEHEIPFNDPQIVEAWDEAAKILKDDANVNAGLGDVRSIATTPWSSAGFGILDGTCWLHRAANFYAAQWPEGTTVAEDGDVWAFYLPAMAEDERPTLVAGPFIAAFNDRPEVQAFQTYLASTDWSNEKAKVSPAGWVSANIHLDPSLLDTDFDRYTYDVLTDPATVAGYDASDQMPSEVGAGTFWSGIVNWLTGQTTQQVVDSIENSWPSD